ncbi:unnamed protein product [Closterium sp. NIES-65]|nr:unnamed protein product [Closterium sp. NIES-65]CAI6009707.1 unnamed protein product [Closterium sp. NIES-65]
MAAERALGPLIDVVKEEVLTAVREELTAHMLLVMRDRNETTAVVERVVELEKELEAVKGEVRAVKGELEAVKGEVKAVKGELAAVKGEFEAVKGELGVVKGELGAVKGEFEAVKGEVKAVKGELAAVKGELAAVKGELGAVKGELGAVKGDLGAVKGELEAVKGELAERGRSLGVKRLDGKSKKRKQEGTEEFSREEERREVPEMDRPRAMEESAACKEVRKTQNLKSNVEAEIRRSKGDQKAAWQHHRMPIWS